MTTQPTFGRSSKRYDHSGQSQPAPETTALENTEAETVEGVRPHADEKDVGSQSRKKQRRAHKNQIFVFFQFCFSVLVLILVGLIALTFVASQQYQAPGPLSERQTYTVRQGAGLTQIASALETRGIISNATLFQLAAHASGRANAMKAGEFQFEPGMSMAAVMDHIVSGRAIEHQVTIVEGMTVLKAFERIGAVDAFAGDLPSDLPPEGSLLADTIAFPRGTLRSDVVERLRDAQAALVEEIWAQRQPDLPLNDINEFVTLASIVEKETGVADERPEVAAVFINRLRQGMRLQSDPTIIYGIFGGEGKPSDRPIFQSDIDTPTEYNTYTIDRLPPGPIAIPGRASLEAVANPAQTDYLFFVADGTGGHAFAQTLQEHNQNVARWREIERQREQQAEDNGS